MNIVLLIAEVIFKIWQRKAFNEYKDMEWITLTKCKKKKKKACLYV